MRDLNTTAHSVDDEGDDDFLAATRTAAQKRIAGEHSAVIEPASARIFRRAPRGERPAAEGVTFSVTIAAGALKGQRLDRLQLLISGAPDFVLGRDARTLLVLAKATGVKASDPAALVNAAARQLFPTKRNPDPPPVFITLSTRVSGGRLIITVERLSIGGRA